MFTNAAFKKEDTEDAVSVYDELEENHYDELNEQNIYLDVLSDVSDGCDESNKPELPRPREKVYLQLISDDAERCDPGSEPQLSILITESQDQNHASDSEGLKERKADHTEASRAAGSGDRIDCTTSTPGQAKVEALAGAVLPPSELDCDVTCSGSVTLNC